MYWIYILKCEDDIYYIGQTMRGANYKCDMQRMYDAVAKLGMPCVFIRYNPDNTKSSKDVLLQTIRNTVNELANNGLAAFNDYGLKVLYLFYKDRSDF